MKFQELPNEILDHIIAFLDILPASYTQSKQEPHLKDLFLPDCPLKTLASTSKTWRQRLFPLLFTYLRINTADLYNSIPRGPVAEWNDARRSSNKAFQMRYWTDEARQRVFQARVIRFCSDYVDLQTDQGELVTLRLDVLNPIDFSYVETMMMHVVDPEDALQSPTSEPNRPPAFSFQDFVAQRNLSAIAQSLVVFEVGDSLPQDSDGPEPSRGAPQSSRAAQKSRRSITPPRPARARNLHDRDRFRIWDALQPMLCPRRIVLLAPPRNLSQLAHCYMDMSDAWAFIIPYQRLEFDQTSSQLRVPPARNKGLIQYDELDQRGKNYADRARMQGISEVLCLRFWDSVRYDEGSSLNAYGTYHYFEKTPESGSPASAELTQDVTQRPPSILGSNGGSGNLLPLGTWLRSFTYTAVFPHFAHFTSIITHLADLPALSSLALQLAPSPHSTLLDDLDAINKGSLSLRDCWNELERCYDLVVSTLLLGPGALVGVAGVALGGRRERLKLLERFECLDCGVGDVEDNLARSLESKAPEWTKTSATAWARNVRFAVGEVGPYGIFNTA